MIVNRLEIRLIGMARSGNHAVAHWILSQAPGRWLCLNCAEGKANPFATARPLDDGRPWLTNLEDFEPFAEREGGFAQKDLLVVTHEDHFLANAASREYERHHDEWVGPSARRIDLLVLRDPYNLFASRLRSGVGRLSDGVALRMWKQHAKEFLGRQRRLRAEPKFVSYNRWVASRAYREDLAWALSFPFTDAGFREVPACAGGSSFDGRDYHGRATRMRVLDRWRHYGDDRAFRRLFDPETRELARLAFGPLKAEALFEDRGDADSAA